MTASQCLWGKSVLEEGIPGPAFLGLLLHLQMRAHLALWFGQDLGHSLSFAFCHCFQWPQRLCVRVQDNLLGHATAKTLIDNSQPGAGESSEKVDWGQAPGRTHNNRELDYIRLAGKLELKINWQLLSSFSDSCSGIIEFPACKNNNRSGRSSNSKLLLHHSSNGVNNNPPSHQAPLNVWCELSLFPAAFPFCPEQLTRICREVNIIGEEKSEIRASRSSSKIKSVLYIILYETYLKMIAMFILNKIK